MEFRAVEQYDLELLRDWRNSDRIRKNTREYRMLNMLNQRSWFNKISLENTNDMFMVYDNMPKKIGVCGLTHINWKDRSAEISYYSSLTDPLKNISLASQVYTFLKKKCFEEYGLNRLWGEIYSHNEVARKIALRNGLREEGILRQTNFYDGKFWDSIITSILAEEYFAK